MTQVVSTPRKKREDWFDDEYVNDWVQRQDGRVGSLSRGIPGAREAILQPRPDVIGRNTPEKRFANPLPFANSVDSSTPETRALAENNVGVTRASDTFKGLDLTPAERLQADR